MAEPRTFYMSIYDEQIKTLFTKHGYVHHNNALDADLVVFGGGPDVTPFLYGEKRHPTTFNIINRDMVELRLLHMLPWYKPKVGICRGAQFLNVTVGRGRLFQDVNNHLKAHEITCLETGRTIVASSTHHQMMRPGPAATVLWVATEATKKSNDISTWDAANPKIDPDFWEDPEIVAYPDDYTLCCQPHPELPSKEYDSLRDVFFEAIDTHLFPSDDDDSEEEGQAICAA